MGQTTAQQRQNWKSFQCDDGAMVRIAFGPDEVEVAPPTRDAWRALACVLKHHRYKVRSADTYGYCCRQITGGSGPSLHSFGIVLDINACTNPYLETPDKRSVRWSDKPTQEERAKDVRLGRADTDFTPEIIEDVRAIRTNGGEPVFEWGGHWENKKDAMHFELDVTPAELATGIDWASVKGFDGEAPVTSWAEEETPLPEIAAFAGELGVFEKCQPVIEKWEGTFDNDPDDPGGATNFGITIGDLARWRKRDVSVQEVADLSRAEARQIFLSFYWKAARCDELPLPLAQMTYDACILTGLRRGGRTLQLALGKQEAGLAVDGTVGPATVNAARRVDVQRAVRDFAEIAEAYLRGRPGFGKYGKGWINRLNDVEGVALGFARSPTPPPPEVVKMPERTISPQPITWIGGREAATEEPADILVFGSKGPKVKALQEALVALDYFVGDTDGIFGRLTLQAVLAFQMESGLATTGQVESAMWSKLADAPKRPLSRERLEITPEELRKKGSRIIEAARQSRLVGLIASVFGIVGMGNSVAVGTANVEVGTGLRTIFDMLPPALPGLEGPATLLAGLAATLLPGFGGSALAFGIGMASRLLSKRVIDYRTQDHRSGANIGR